MANWQRKLNLKDVWNSKDVHLIAKTASERLKELQPLGLEEIDSEREDIAYDFAAVASDHDADTSDFDEVMERLYDWADAKLDDNWNGKKVCWIATF